MYVQCRKTRKHTDKKLNIYSSSINIHLNIYSKPFTHMHLHTYEQTHTSTHTHLKIIIM